MKNYQSISIHNGVEDDGENELSKTKTNSIQNTHPQDHLAPPFSSNTTDRPSTLFISTFNLIATIIGGAVLSLPIVFQKCGIAFTTLAMSLSAYMTYMSLLYLVYASRRGGGSSYGEVVRSAFGERFEEGVSWLLFVFLLFVIMGYMVLIRDIWTPLVRQILPSTMVMIDGQDENGDDIGDYVLLGITVLMMPFMFQRSLYALRYNCYVGSASTLVLCIALCRGGYQRLNSSKESDSSDNTSLDDIEFFKIPSIPDILFSFPIVTLSFLCHFNIIAIQNALQKPTRARTQSLIKYSIWATFGLMYVFGLGGYLYAGDETRGNILLNVPMEKVEGEDNGEYWLFLLGRIGCGTTIMLAMPMMALPCREALLEVVDVWFHHTHHLSDNVSVASSNEEAALVASPTAQNNENNNESFCWKLFHRCNKSETMQDATITTEDEVTEMVLPDNDNDENGESNQNGRAAVQSSPLLRRSRSRSSSFGQRGPTSVLIRHDPIQSDYVFRNTLAHYGSTLLITISCYLGAVAVSGVAVVWSFIGSSLAFFIAFILPCGCFIVTENAVPTKKEGGDRQVVWVRIAWAILCFSIVGALICTINNTIGFGR